jgi:hypothetical protein
VRTTPKKPESEARPVDSLTAEDFSKSPVWRFTGSDAPDETYVTPVRQLPIRRLAGCIVGGPIHLANRTVLTGFLGNLEPTNPRLTEHFLTLSVFRSDGALFHLARYHDFDAAERGPAALAAFLALPLEAVFPITYDVSRSVAGRPDSICGTITVQPRERLTRPEIIALAVP